MGYYDVKFKESALKHLSKGHTQESTAKQFGIGTSTLKEWKRRKEANESLAPKIRKRKPKKLPPDELRAYVDANPDAYLFEIAQHFNCTISPVERALKKHKITRKKRR